MRLDSLSTVASFQLHHQYSLKLRIIFRGLCIALALIGSAPSLNAQTFDAGDDRIYRSFDATGLQPGGAEFHRGSDLNWFPGDYCTRPFPLPGYSESTIIGPYSLPVCTVEKLCGWGSRQILLSQTFFKDGTCEAMVSCCFTVRDLF